MGKELAWVRGRVLDQQHCYICTPSGLCQADVEFGFMSAGANDFAIGLSINAGSQIRILSAAFL